jgi:hypothetical protein
METKGIITNLNIVGLQRRWEMLQRKHGINKFIITEYFQRHNNRSLVINDLAMEIDNGWVSCYDKKDILLKEYSILSLFLKHQLTKIVINPFVDERLEFGTDGYIIIKVEK